MQAGTGSYTLWRCTRLCCRPQLAQVLVTSVAGTNWGREVLLCRAITACSWNIDLCPAPRREQASVCLMSPSPQKHLCKPALGRSHSGPINNCPQERVSSSFASLSWTRDFFTQITLENHHYAKTLSAMVKISWGKGQFTLRCPSRVISRSSYHGIWTGMLLAGHLSCKRKNKRCTNYTAKTTMSRVIYILIVLIWGPSADSLKEAAAEKTSILLLNFTASLYSGKRTWKEAQLYYILMNFLSTLGRCFKHCNRVCIK